MLFNLIKRYRGKTTIIMTNTRTRCQDRKKQLMDSQSKMKVEYYIEETEREINFYPRLTK